MVERSDKSFDALANSQRRQLLFALLEESPQTDTPTAYDSPPETRRIEYLHTHLPKLDEYGYIEWSPGMNAVERGPRFDEIKPLLELLYSHQTELSRPE